AGRPPFTKYSFRISGVFAKKFPRKYSAVGGCVSSSRYWRSSHGLFFHVKYVYDAVKPSLASAFIRLGRVNDSEKKITSGCSPCPSSMTHSQNASGLVCGLSTRKIFTPWSIQYSKTSRQAFHSPCRSSHQKFSG